MERSDFSIFCYSAHIWFWHSASLGCCFCACLESWALPVREPKPAVHLIFSLSWIPLILSVWACSKDVSVVSGKWTLIYRQHDHGYPKTVVSDFWSITVRDAEYLQLTDCKVACHIWYLAVIPGMAFTVDCSVIWQRGCCYFNLWI